MELELSKRLQTIANKINRGNIIADIGTDHAYIPIYLCKKGVIKNSIASDISKGSLEKARINISKYNLSHSIETRLSNGLDKITLKDNLDTIIIAGMGGMLAIDILKKNTNLVNSLEKIILQPQKDIDVVRKYIHSINFVIESDEILIDENKYYNVIVAKNNMKNTSNKDIYTEKDYIFGKFEIEQKSKVLKAYITQQLISMESIIDLLNKESCKNNSISNRIKKLNYKYELYKEVLECL